MQTTIITLYRKGYSKSHIAREVGADRKTVRKVISNYESGKEILEKKPHPSFWDTHESTIKFGLSKGLSIMRIFQDLQAITEITGSYSGLRDYVRKTFPDKKMPTWY